MKQIIGACLVVLLFPGCSAFTAPKAKPVIEDRVSAHSRKTIGVLATTPERRVFLVKMPDHKFCAEPPADAADNVAHALSAAAGASGKGNLGEAQAGFAQSLATSVKQLFVRTQGLQLYRDGNFLLCEAYLNGVITNPDEYMSRQHELLMVSKELIAKEIPELYKWKFDTSTVPTAIHTDVESSRDAKSGAHAQAGAGEGSPSKPNEDKPDPAETDPGR